MGEGEQVGDGPSEGIKSHFSGRGFALALTRIRRLAVQIKAIKTEDLTLLTEMSR